MSRPRVVVRRGKRAVGGGKAGVESWHRDLGSTRPTPSIVANRFRCVYADPSDRPHVSPRVWDSAKRLGTDRPRTRNLSLMSRRSSFAPVDHAKSAENQTETQSVSFDVALFPLRPSRPFQTREKPKETRSVSEGFFDFSNQPSTRYTTNTSV